MLYILLIYNNIYSCNYDCLYAAHHEKRVVNSIVSKYTELIFIPSFAMDKLSSLTLIELYVWIFYAKVEKKSNKVKSYFLNDIYRFQENIKYYANNRSIDRGELEIQAMEMVNILNNILKKILRHFKYGGSKKSRKIEGNSVPARL